MYVVLVEFSVHKEKHLDFLQRVRQQARDSLALEAACQVFDVCHDPHDDSRVVLYEVYDNEAAFKLHLQSDHFKAFDADVRDWIVNKVVSLLQRD